MDAATVKGNALDKGDPEPLATVTWAVPALLISEAVIWAVNLLLLINVVARPAPFQLTLAPDAKPVPLTVRVKG